MRMKKVAEIINISDDERYSIEKAVEIYNNGGIFIYPTDTIYGLGCNPFSKFSREKLNKLKGRESDKQFILLVNSIESLAGYTEISEKISFLLNKIWPAPLTAILKLNSDTEKIIDYSTAAFRIPNNKFCLQVLNKIRTPLVSTSVNISGREPLNTAEQITSSEFKNKVDAIFINPNEEPAQPSTIVDLTGNEPEVIRNGKINFMDLWVKIR